MGGLLKIVSNFFDSILGGREERPAIPPPPVFEPPPVMPTSDDEAVKASKRRSIAGQVARRGRQSTILTQNEDAVGSALAGADKLGA